MLREFEPLWNDPVAQTYLRPEDFASRHVAAARAKAEREPRDLHQQSNLLEVLLINSRYSEIVSSARETLSRLSSYGSNPEAEGWVRNNLAEALHFLGDYDAAAEAIRPVVRAATRRDAYLGNFSINYGLMSLRHGNYNEARYAARLATRGPITDYARSLIRYTDACALHGLGRDREAEKALNAMLASSGQTPSVTFDALLCFDRLDQAADVLVRMLADERLRARALRKLQGCTDHPMLPQSIREEHAKILALRDRPEVRRAIDAVAVIVDRPDLCGGVG